MERKCQTSGVTFTVDKNEARFLKEFGLPLPNRTEIERLRYLLSFIPNMEACLSKNSLFTLTANNGYIPRPRLQPILATNPASDKLPDLKGELCFNILFDLFNYWKSGNLLEYDTYCNYFSLSCKGIADTYFSLESEQLVQCLFVTSSKRLFNAVSCVNCEDSYFIENCEECKNCLFCCNLKGVQYHIFNQEVSRDEYESIFNTLMLTEPLQLDSAVERFANFLKMQTLNAKATFNSDSQLGRYVKDSSVSNYIFLSQNIRNSNLVFGGYDIENSYGIALSGPKVSNIYQSMLITGPASGIRNSYLCGPEVSELDYCIGCTNSNHLMFCVGLDNASYCIFNQQYSKVAYTKNIELLKSMFSKDIDWGYQMPLLFSLVGYNESLASTFFPLNKVQATLLAYNWNSDLDILSFSREVSLESLCEISGMPFTSLDSEIDLRNKLAVSKPTRAPAQRFSDMISSLEFSSDREAKCGYSGDLFRHYYRGNRLVVSC